MAIPFRFLFLPCGVYIPHHSGLLFGSEIFPRPSLRRKRLSSSRFITFPSSSSVSLPFSSHVFLHSSVQKKPRLKALAAPPFKEREPLTSSHPVPNPSLTRYASRFLSQSRHVIRCGSSPLLPGPPFFPNDNQKSSSPGSAIGRYTRPRVLDRDVAVTCRLRFFTMCFPPLSPPSRGAFTQPPRAFSAHGHSCSAASTDLSQRPLTAFLLPPFFVLSLPF